MLPTSSTSLSAQYTWQTDGAAEEKAPPGSTAPLPNQPTNTLATNASVNTSISSHDDIKADSDIIDIHVSDWSQLTDVKRSSDGTTGIYFLYFNDEIIPKLCLKMPDNPYSEHFASTLFSEMGLKAPQSRLLDRASPTFTALKAQLDSLSLIYENERLPDKSDRSYSLLMQLKSELTPGHVLLMECIVGKNLEEARPGDWSIQSIQDPTFFTELGIGLATDAFILNSDRFQFLFADNLGNLRLPYRSSPVETQENETHSLCFIDQSVDALRTKEPQLLDLTLIDKFKQLVDMVYQRKPASTESEQVAQSIIGSLINIAVATPSSEIRDKGLSNKTIFFNELDYTASLDSIVEDFCQSINTYARYTVSTEEKTKFKEGIQTGFELISEKLSAPIIQARFEELPEHKLTSEIPIDLLFKNHEYLLKQKNADREIKEEKTA